MPVEGALGAMPCPGSFLYLLPVLLDREDVKNNLATPSHHDICPRP